MRDSWIDVLIGGIGQVSKNQNVARTLSRERLATAIPLDKSLQGDDLAEWRADNEAKVYSEFLTRGYLHLPEPDKEIEFAIETYSKVFVTMKFVFDLSQSNSAGASIDLLTVVSRGTLTSPIGGSVTGKRQSVLEKVAGTRVVDLLTNRPIIRICNHYRRGETPTNLLYPIAGRLNLKNDVRNFITDNQSGNLIGQLSDTALLTAATTPPVPSVNKTYTFTTTLTGGLKDAKLDLQPRPSGTSAKLATFSLGADRTDIHKLILVLQLPNATGLTIAQTRNQREAAEYEQQLNSSARELLRIEDRDRAASSEVLRLIRGD